MLHCRSHTVHCDGDLGSCPSANQALLLTLWQLSEVWCKIYLLCMHTSVPHSFTLALFAQFGLQMQMKPQLVHLTCGINGVTEIRRCLLQVIIMIKHNILLDLVGDLQQMPGLVCTGKCSGGEFILPEFSPEAHSQILISLPVLSSVRIKWKSVLKEAKASTPLHALDRRT